MSRERMTILRCENKSHWKLLERVPERIHGDDACFVPPFPGSVVKLLVPPAPITKGGKVAGFVALRDGKAVGRIVAILSRGHQDYYKDRTGFFGYFDFIDDPDVSSALLDTAESQLKTWGCDSMRGPFQPTSNDESGLLVEGFDRPPFVMMPYNPAYYLKHYEALGLKKAVDLLAYYISGSADVPERVIKIADRAKRTLGVTFRNVDLSKLDQELSVIQTLYNQTLDRNWEFVPLTREDVEFAASDLKAIVDPNLVMFAEKDGVPVGYCLLVPNVNELLLGTAKQPSWMRMVRFLWRLKTKGPKEIRLVGLGVAPAFRGKGIEAVFYVESLLRGRAKFRGGELSWVEESNEPIRRGIEAMGAKVYKKYRLFERSL